MTILKADDQAATRLLKAAVRKAREQIAAGDNAAVVDMLTEAGRSAELLIGGGRRG